MSTINDNISDILDIDKYQTPEILEALPEVLPEVLPKDLPEVLPEVLFDNLDDINRDVEFARNNIKELISKGNRALDELSLVARESEHPRSYEVFATLLKNMSDMNKDLLELQKRKKDLAPKDYKSNQNINVDKAVVFTGSTAELIKLIKQNKED